MASDTERGDEPAPDPEALSLSFDFVPRVSLGTHLRGGRMGRTRIKRVISQGFAQLVGMYSAPNDGNRVGTPTFVAVDQNGNLMLSPSNSDVFQLADGTTKTQLAAVNSTGQISTQLNALAAALQAGTSLRVADTGDDITPFSTTINLTVSGGATPTATYNLPNNRGLVSCVLSLTQTASALNVFLSFDGGTTFTTLPFPSNPSITTGVSLTVGANAIKVTNTSAVNAATVQLVGTYKA